MISEKEKLKYKRMNQEELNEAISNISFECHYDQSTLEHVQYLLTSSDLRAIPNIHQDDDSLLRWACKTGQLKVIKYILTSPELKEHADIHVLDDICLSYACNNRDLELIEYLLNSPTLKNHSNPYSILKQFAVNKKFRESGIKEVIDYIIFDCHIKITTEIKELRKNEELINSLFNTKELKEKLQNSLTPKDIICKKNKI